MSFAPVPPPATTDNGSTARARPGGSEDTTRGAEDTCIMSIYLYYFNTAVDAVYFV